MDIIKVILTSVLSVAALFAVTKVMGHKQVAQFDFFDYVSGITIGSIGAELATELEEPHKPLIALFVYGIVSVALIYVTNKFPRLRKFINGSPSVLFDKGKIYRENMTKAKLDFSEFLLLCRTQGYFDLDEIETAVFEQNGKLSVLPKADKRPVTPSDIGLDVGKNRVGIEFIADGRVLGRNLKRAGIDEKWLKNELKKQGFSSEIGIMLAIFHPEDGSLSIYAEAEG